MDDISRRVVRRLLSRLRWGRLELFEPGGYSVFGDQRAADPVTAHIRVKDPHFYTAFFRGSLGLAESYRDGEWDCDDLTALPSSTTSVVPAATGKNSPRSHHRRSNSRCL